ncbi:MAG TPA: ATP-dependent Clp protease proteolytic subunit [Verrucomicrobiae bacterium]|nr:ATP-dependent Clp protease proteolytic subunit [Verrucomicrobiae bacterium]
MSDNQTPPGQQPPPQPRPPQPIIFPPGMVMQVPDTYYVSFSAEINPNTTESLISVVANLVNQRVKTIYLLLSTPGGSVMNGMNVYSVLRGMPVELITHNVGNVDSIGNAIFLAGSKRYATPQSTFMFHGVGFDIANRTRLEEKNLREQLQSVLSDQKRIGSIITERTKISEEDASALFREAQTKDAAYAVSMGIVHEIRDVQIPVGGPVISLVFQRQAV